MTEKSDFLVATSSALANKGVSAAIADYIGRLIKAYQYLDAHPQAVIQTVYEGQYGLTPARAAVRRQAGRPVQVLPAARAPSSAAQQNLANLYLAAGSIPAQSP